jgi:hypothetical protein
MDELRKEEREKERKKENKDLLQWSPQVKRRKLLLLLLLLSSNFSLLSFSWEIFTYPGI